MSRLAVSGSDAVFVLVDRAARDQPEAARRLLVRTGSMLLNRPESEVTVGRRPDGRPFLSAGPACSLHVSVSHSRETVAVAASANHPVGVDVEDRRYLRAYEMAGRYFDPSEVAWLRAQPSERLADGFLWLWTAKEAVGKALGAGLRDAGLRRRVPVPPRPGLVLRPLPGNPELRVAYPPTAADAVLAVALVGGDARTEVVVAEAADHDVARRSTEGSRTSLPVVVRGS